MKFNKKTIGQVASAFVLVSAITITAVSVNHNDKAVEPEAKTAITTTGATAGISAVLNSTSQAASFTSGVSNVLVDFAGVSLKNKESQVVAMGQSEEEDGTFCGYTNLGLATVSEGNLNVRSSAGTDGKIVGKMTNHNACEILGVEGEWTQIASGKVTGYVKSEFLITGEAALEIAKAEVNTYATVGGTATLRVRSEASTDSSTITLVGEGEDLVVISEEPEWVCVEVDDETGYIYKEYVSSIAQKLPTAKTIQEVRYGMGVSDVRVDLVSYALQFVGNPYVWGGTSLTKGTDCSGFTMQILGKYGVSLPHSSRSQPSYGTKISASEAKPGDLFFYGNGSSINHVAIYIGNGQIVHASNKRDGIKISNAYYRTPVCVARYFD